MLISSTLVKVQINVMCGVQCKVMNAKLHTFMAVRGCGRKHSAWASGQREMGNNTWYNSGKVEEPIF